MNINTYNYGHYRVTDYGRGKYQLFNRNNDQVYSITQEQFRNIQGHRSVEACRWVEEIYNPIIMVRKAYNFG